MDRGEDVGMRRQSGRGKLVAGEGGQSQNEDSDVSLAGSS